MRTRSGGLLSLSRSVRSNVQIDHLLQRPWQLEMTATGCLEKDLYPPGQNSCDLYPVAACRGSQVEASPRLKVLANWTQFGLGSLLADDHVWRCCSQS